MGGWLLRLFGRHAAHSVIAKQTQGGALDVRLGMALLRDRRVPLRAKLFAMAFGMAITAALVALELPLEALLAALLPFFGVVLDAAVDGMEGLLGTLLLSALLVQRFTPQPLLAQIRAERAASDTRAAPPTSLPTAR